jgi:hypothetical protein
MPLRDTSVSSVDPGAKQPPGMVRVKPNPSLEACVCLTEGVGLSDLGGVVSVSVSVCVVLEETVVVVFTVLTGIV